VCLSGVVAVSDRGKDAATDHWSLRAEVEPGRYEHRSPAMAAGLADHIWSVAELLNRQFFDTS
jgi:hypothetical protein